MQTGARTVIADNREELNRVPLSAARRQIRVIRRDLAAIDPINRDGIASVDASDNCATHSKWQRTGMVLRVEGGL